MTPEKKMKNNKTNILTAAQVRKLPVGAKVVRKTKLRDEVCTVVYSGRHKKLFYHDKWHGPMKWMPITDKDIYLRAQ